mmetsp:Transcript_44482/g.88896  ORF Transcript_44482/g.88896 Transcript_44482/m.88896 type:complete len:226 (-) Transcript_44482:374-1051(-)|eukprot:CAMPEP_0174721000 /NCGR_PEP_ID=MMETSP1094-20130205/35117_1 /TAXON_ID=156173 /ORGANISM="Chrysochromulina brevifilum, Strain UTEX LB 985" /LENGTH=225 /DNA_ID=CAMNT_0015921601 /DNA_START=39 /DNA_END=716 /DNA_ORIENTATION=-
MASAFGDDIAPYESSAFANTGTNARTEERRLKAHHEAQNYANFPTFVVLNHIEIPICKYSELDGLKFANLKQRAFNLRDIIDSTDSNFFGHYPHLALRATNAEAVVAWFIAVQVEICNALGYQFDNASFGAPADENYSAPMISGRRTMGAPCWSQHNLELRPQSSSERGYQVKAPYGSQQDSSQSSRRPSSGYQVKAPFATGEPSNSSDDAAHNRARNQSSARPF